MYVYIYIYIYIYTCIYIYVYERIIFTRVKGDDEATPLQYMIYTYMCVCKYT